MHSLEVANFHHTEIDLDQGMLKKKKNMNLMLPPCRHCYFLFLIALFLAAKEGSGKITGQGRLPVKFARDDHILAEI